MTIEPNFIEIVLYNNPIDKKLTSVQLTVSLRIDVKP